MDDIRVEDRNIDEAVTLRYLDVRRVKLSLQLLSSQVKAGALTIRCNTMEVLVYSVFNPYIALAYTYTDELVFKLSCNAKPSLINAILNQVSFIPAVRVLRLCEDVSRRPVDRFIEEYQESNNFDEILCASGAVYPNCDEYIRASFGNLEVCDLSAVKVSETAFAHIFSSFSEYIREVIFGGVRGDLYRVRSKLIAYFARLPNLKRVFLGEALLSRESIDVLPRELLYSASILYGTGVEREVNSKSMLFSEYSLHIEFYEQKSSLADILWPKMDLEYAERAPTLLLRYFKYGVPVEHEVERILHLDDMLSNFCLSKSLSGEYNAAELVDEVFIPVNRMEFVSRENELVNVNLDGNALRFVFIAGGYFPAWIDPCRYAELFELCISVLRGNALQGCDFKRLKELLA